jgi:hypothetical protein
MKSPIVLASPRNVFSGDRSVPPLWHTEAVGSRPHHQNRQPSHLLYQVGQAASWPGSPDSQTFQISQHQWSDPDAGTQTAAESIRLINA